MKLSALIFVFFIIYSAIAYDALRRSDFNNVLGYCLSPPAEDGDIGIERLPMIFGEKITRKILKKKILELDEVERANRIDYITALSLHKADITDIQKQKIRIRGQSISLILKDLGIELNKASCMIVGISAKQTLIKWNTFDDINEKFLNEHFEDELDKDCPSVTE